MAARVTDEQLRKAVSTSKNWREALGQLGIKLSSGSSWHYKQRSEKIGVSSAHFVRSNRGVDKKLPEDILVLREEGARAYAKQLVRALLATGRKHECAKCGQGTEWMGNKLTLDVDHINENWLDDRAENLRFLCPNCHSQFSRRLIKQNNGDVA